MSTEPEASRQHESRDQSHQHPSETETGGQDASRPTTDDYTRRCERLRALLARCKEGDQQAWQQLHDDWDGPLRLIIRSRLRRARWYARCQRRFGDSDLRQEAWKTLYIKLTEVDEQLTPEHFLAYLKRISDNLVRHAHRDHCLTEKRTVEREQPIPTSLQRRDPPPDQVVETKDAWDSWLDTLPQDRRGVATMVRQGHTHEEIAKALGSAWPSARSSGGLTSCGTGCSRTGRLGKPRSWLLHQAHFRADLAFSGGAAKCRACEKPRPGTELPTPTPTRQPREAGPKQDCTGASCESLPTGGCSEGPLPGTSPSFT